jgi:hypothetical protein
MDDDTLMTTFYACSEDAFQEVFHRYFQRLVHFLRQFVSLEDAEDLANEALDRGHSGDSKRNGRDSPLPCPKQVEDLFGEERIPSRLIGTLLRGGLP